MYASNYIFSRTFFNAWIVVAIIWLWCTMLVAGFFPLIDGRAQLFEIWRALRSGKTREPKPSPQDAGSLESSAGVSVENLEPKA